MFTSIAQNFGFTPSGASAGFNPEVQGSGDYSGAFSGLGDGVQRVTQNQGGTYSVIRTAPGATDPMNGQIATLIPGQGGYSLSDWSAYTPTPTAQILKEFGLGAAAMAGGLYGLGQLGGAAPGAIGGAPGVIGGGGGIGAGAAGSPMVGSIVGNAPGIAGVAGEMAASSMFPAAVDPIASAAGGLFAEGLGVSPGYASLLPAGVGGLGSTVTNALGSLGSFAKDNPNLLNFGGSLLNGYLGSKATGNAVDAQVKAAADANALNKYMYDTTRADYAPWLKAGGQAITTAGNLAQNPGSITSDPGYQFGLGEGQKAIDRSASARGNLYSGATLKALNRYGQDYGSTKLDSAINRNLAIAGQGQIATGGVANAGQNYANNTGQNIIGAGNSRASGYVGGANAWGGALNNAFSNWQQQNLLDQILGRKGP